MIDLQEKLAKGQTCVANILRTDNNLYGYNRENAEYKTLLVVIGCGGTGSRLIPDLSQYVSNHNEVLQSSINHNQYLKHKIGILIIDPDQWEQKNLRRQNMIKADIGKGKARTISERYSAIYGMDIEYKEENFKLEHINSKSDLYNVIIFDCVDSIKSRKEIESNLVKIKCNNIIYISMGNGADTGQVIYSQVKKNCSYSTLQEYYIKSYFELSNYLSRNDLTFTNNYEILNIPTFLSLYPDLEDDEIPVNCTNIQLQDAQSMPINKLVANIAFNIFYKIISGNNLKYHMVKCSTNNIFTTSFINNPYDMLDLLCKGIYGIANEEVKNILTEAKNLEAKNFYLYIDNTNFFVNNNGKYTNIFYDKYVKNNLYIKDKEAIRRKIDIDLGIIREENASV